METNKKIKLALLLIVLLTLNSIYMPFGFTSSIAIGAVMGFYLGTLLRDLI